MSDAKLLSPEELSEALDYLREDAQTKVRAHIAALEAERDAALADNAAFDEAMQRIRNEADNIPSEWGGRIVALCNGTMRDHPGAALLEAHAKAVEAAHVDGYRHALLQALDRLGMDSAVMYGDPEATQERLATELWEHVRRMEARAKNEGIEAVAREWDGRAASLRSYEERATGEKSRLEWAERAEEIESQARGIRAMKERE